MAVIFPHLPFDPAETPLSFATRLAAFHTGGRLVPFLHDIGVAPTDLVGGKPDAVSRLCAVAGVDTAPVLRNTAVRLARRRFALRGEEISAEFLSSPDTVFCPACQNPAAPELSLQDRRPGRVDAVHLKHVLGKIDPDGGRLFHGWLP